MFEEDVPTDGAEGAMAIIPSDFGDLIQWLFHVVAATLMFIGLGVCAFLYAWHIGPKTLKLGLESPSDVHTRMVRRSSSPARRRQAAPPTPPADPPR
jgi:hypothetical protein